MVMMIRMMKIDGELDADVDKGCQHAFPHASRRCLQQHLRLQRFVLSRSTFLHPRGFDLPVHRFSLPFPPFPHCPGVRVELRASQD